VAKYVYLTLRLARETVGAAVPSEVIADLTPGDFEPRLIALAREEILGAPTTARTSPRFARMWGTMRIRRKVSLLGTTLFPPSRTMRRLYPPTQDSRWLYLYYPVRWKDLTLKYGLSVWHLIRRNERVVSVIEREHERAVLMDWLACVR
jgi:hypothetical protein